MTQLLTETEAADRLRLKPRTLALLRATGRGPEFYKLGRAVRYAPEDIEAWLSAKKQKAESRKQKAE